MTDRRAVVTGLGIVSPVGIGAEASWDALVAGRSGIDRITLFDPTPFDVDVAGEVKGFDAAQYMDAKDARRHDRNTHFAVAATGEALRDAGLTPEKLTALDFGAGNGMVGELLAELTVGEIVGVDLLPEARDAAHRDRPGLYQAYYALDMTQLTPEDRRSLMRHDFDLMTCVAALGFGDIPPLAFAEAFNLVGSPGWIAFNIRDRFLEEDTSGFGGLIAKMFREGVLEERASSRYTHRISVAGEPLEYVAIVAEKHGNVPLEWAEAAS